ncbi:MAG: hypothetical protein A2X08_13300, partial [Bacteroidetes bacterium GWA2_32_17]
GTNNPEATLHVLSNCENSGTTLRLQYNYTPPVQNGCTSGISLWDIAALPDNILTFTNPTLIQPAITILQDGKIGFGTSTPKHTLDVHGHIGLVDHLIFNGTSTAGVINWPESESLWFRTNSIPGDIHSYTTRMIITGDGNVGIGTDAPMSTLQVGAGSSKFSIGNSSGVDLGYGTSYIGFNASRLVDNTWKFNSDGIHNGGAVISNSIGGNIYFIPVSSNNGSSDISYSDAQLMGYNAMTILSDGNVGIGISEPVAKLHINAQYNTNQYVYGSKIEIRNTSSSANYVFGQYIEAFDGYAPSSNVFGIYVIAGQGGHGGAVGVQSWGEKAGLVGNTNSGYGIEGSAILGTAGYFSSLSGYGLLVEKGNVGIGTITPGSKLTVNGTITASGSSSDEWTNSHWGVPLIIPNASAIRTSSTGGYLNKYLGFGMSDDDGVGGWYWITSCNTDVTESPIYPMSLTLDPSDGGSPTLTIQKSTWCDFVFDKNYKLLPLNELENFIDTCKHLPDIPSAEEIINNGLDLGGMQTKQMQKIEELYLYLIKQDKVINKQQLLINELKEKTYKLEQMVNH